MLLFMGSSVFAFGVERGRRHSAVRHNQTNGDGKALNRISAPVYLQTFLTELCCQLKQSQITRIDDVREQRVMRTYC